MLRAGFDDIDPSHPRGGKDGGKDATMSREGETWIMAAYFPHGDKSFAEVKKKLLEDAAGVAKNKAHGMTFVTNQKLTLGERKELQGAVSFPVELHHRDKIALVLDSPDERSLRHQFLGIPADDAEITDEPGSWPAAYRHRLAQALTDDADLATAFFRGKLIRRILGHQLLERDSDATIKVAEIDGADVLTVGHPDSPRRWHIWIDVNAGAGRLTAGALPQGNVLATIRKAEQRLWSFDNVGDAAARVEDACDWILKRLAEERNG